jgi:hypothetical protein
MFASSLGLGIRFWLFNRSSSPPVSVEATPSIGLDSGVTFWRSDFVVPDAGTPQRLRGVVGTYLRADISVTMWKSLTIRFDVSAFLPQELSNDEPIFDGPLILLFGLSIGLDLMFLEGGV